MPNVQVGCVISIALHIDPSFLPHLLFLHVFITLEHGRFLNPLTLIYSFALVSFEYISTTKYLNLKYSPYVKFNIFSCVKNSDLTVCFEVLGIHY